MKKEWIREENGVTIVTTCAWSPPGCHPVGCGLKLHVKNNRLIKVEGDENHPITQGRVCPRCLALLEYVYHPHRITHPMQRVGKHGENKWQRISWDEAYDTIVDKVHYYKEKFGAESIIVFGGTGRLGGNYYNPLAFMALGTPNSCYGQSGWSCYAPRAVVNGFIVGVGYPEVDYACRFPDRYDHPGWQLPKYIILWGKEPLKSNPDGFFGHSIIDMMKRGTKLIIVDPRISWLATRAEHVLKLRPGTDAALALGLLHVIINEDLYDHEFVEKFGCFGDRQALSAEDGLFPKQQSDCAYVLGSA